MVNAYTPGAIERATAGVHCIEHGHLADDATAALIADTGTWWSLQPFLADDDAAPLADPAARAKHRLVTDGTDQAYELARRHGVKVAWGSDILFDAALAARQGRVFEDGPMVPPLEVLTWRPPPTPSCWLSGRAVRTPVALVVEHGACRPVDSSTATHVNLGRPPRPTRTLGQYQERQSQSDAHSGRTSYPPRPRSGSLLRARLKRREPDVAKACVPVSRAPGASAGSQERSHLATYRGSPV